MARLRGHSTLDASRPLYVKRASLTLHGRAFKQGEPFNWRALGITPRLLLKLWQQRRIGHERPDERNGAEPQGELVKPIAAEPTRARKRKRTSADETLADSLSDAELERLTRPE